MSAKTIEELVQELNIIVSEICKIAKFEKNIISQLKRSSTSIGANKAEAKFSESRADFIHKMGIALKECSETIYWIDTLYSANVIDCDLYKRARNISGIIEKKLIASIKTARSKL